MAPLASVQELLDGVEARSRSHASADRPFVTVSWAQGIDGSMAHAPEASRERLMLSGSASMAMTHGLRALHEGILVGRGTVSGDDPRLTVRFAGSGEALEAGAAPLDDLRRPDAFREHNGKIRKDARVAVRREKAAQEGPS